jgi:hypothetical protein
VNTDYDGRQVVGIDLHRRRGVIVQQTDSGQPLGVTRIANDPFTLAEQAAGWGEAPQASWRPRTAGTGPPTCWPRSARRCTWPTRSG